MSIYKKRQAKANIDAPNIEGMVIKDTPTHNIGNKFPS